MPCHAEGTWGIAQLKRCFCLCYRTIQTLIYIWARMSRIRSACIRLNIGVKKGTSERGQTVVYGRRSRTAATWQWPVLGCKGLKKLAGRCRRRLSWVQVRTSSVMTRKPTVVATLCDKTRGKRSILNKPSDKMQVYSICICAYISRSTACGSHCSVGFPDREDAALVDRTCVAPALNFE